MFKMAKPVRLWLAGLAGGTMLVLGACSESADAKADRILQQLEEKQPSLRALRENDAATYAQLRDAFKELASRDTQPSEPELIARLLPILTTAMQHHIRAAPDAVLKQYATDSADMLDALKSNPQTCADASRGRSVSFYSQLPESLRDRMGNTLGRIFASNGPGNGHVMDGAETDRLLQPVVAELQQTHSIGEAEINAALAGTGPAANTCTIFGTMFRRVSEMPEDQAAGFMRYSILNAQ